ncbi:MAG: hypothetical protein KGN01_06775 [Patescibacteria group bacterium]|nr:hypothetical protein [Patescibacteria group bacterium]
MKGPVIRVNWKQEGNYDPEGATVTARLSEMSATELNIALRQAVDSIHSGALYSITITATEIIGDRARDGVIEQLAEALGQESVLKSTNELEESRALKVEETVA